MVFAGVQAAGSAAVFVVTARKDLGAAIRTPQWLLLGPLAFGFLATCADHAAGLAAGALVGLIARSSPRTCSGAPAAHWRALAIPGPSSP